MKTIVITLGILLLPTFRALADFSGKVLHVEDGDLIRVEKEGAPFNVRLYAVDAPESDQPYGEASKKRLAELVLNKNVHIKARGYDRKKRFLGEIFSEKENINLKMLEDGYGWWVTSYPGSFAAAGRKDFQAAQKRAFEAGRGLWKDPVMTPPWEWRKGKRIKDKICRGLLYKECQRTVREQSRIPKNLDLISRVGRTLTINLRNGKKLTYSYSIPVLFSPKDVAVFVDGYISSHDLIVTLDHYYEGAGYSLIDAKNGVVTRVAAYPVLSPDKTHFVISNVDLMVQYTNTTLEIWKFQKDAAPQKVFSIEPKMWGPKNAHWKNTHTVRAKRVISTMAADYHEIGDVLVHRKGDRWEAKLGLLPFHDTGVAGIRILNPESTKAIIENKFLTSGVDAGLRRTLRCSNNAGDAFLELVFHPGNDAHSVVAFRVARKNKNERTECRFKKQYRFNSDRGVELMMPIRYVETMFGEPTSVETEGDRKILHYRDEDVKRSEFLKKHKKSMYCARYEFRNDILAGFAFGFDCATREK